MDGMICRMMQMNGKPKVTWMTMKKNGMIRMAGMTGMTGMTRLTELTGITGISGVTRVTRMTGMTIDDCHDYG